jgi:putative mRNA 3-end processing factor
MKLIFHGAAQEVGRSCIELQTNKERYLLDCGVKFKDYGLEYPTKVFEIPELDGVFLSHAHLDHSGALPFFEHHNLPSPIFTTIQTLGITRILLKDSYKIARIKRIYPAYDKLDLKEVRKDTKLVRFDRDYKHKSIKFRFYNAGHIPGSAAIKITAENKTLVYTGDMNTRDTMLMIPADNDYGDVDVFITESTYGYRKLPDREQTKKAFLDKIEEVINRGGSALIPVFALGRAQEVLLMLSERRWRVPIYFEGMCKKITRKILSNPSKYVKNKSLLAKMYYKKVQIIGSPRRRNMALRKPGIYVTTSGMMQGGPVLSYVKELWHDPRNAILLMGFQCKRTNGRMLLEEHYLYIDGWKTDVKCEIQKYDFSGHMSQENIKDLIKKVNPKILIIQHGDPKSVANIKEWAEKNMKCKVYGPVVGDEIII